MLSKEETKHLGDIWQQFFPKESYFPGSSDPRIAAITMFKQFFSDPINANFTSNYYLLQEKHVDIDLEVLSAKLGNLMSIWSNEFANLLIMICDISMGYRIFRYHWNYSDTTIRSAGMYRTWNNTVCIVIVSIFYGPTIDQSETI